jgi:hypothetical protein
MYFKKLYFARSLALCAVVSAAGGAALQAPMAWSQAAASGSVTGFVLDPDKAAVPGATVTLTPATGTARIVTSGGDGAYTFRNVPAGVYSLTVTMPGFSSFVRQGVRVSEAALTLNAGLTVQSESTEVNVTTENAHVSVDADSNGSSVVIKDKDLEALSDDPDELADQLSALAGPSAGPNGGQIYIDGFTGGTLPPKSSIREIRVNQNPFSAQYDKQGFGRVEVFTKPGTDKYHGQISLQGNAKAFNTSSPFLGSSNVQPDYHRLFLIGSLTGPLTKTSSYSLAGSYRDIEDNSIFAGQIVSTGPTSGTLCAPGNAACTLNLFPDTLRATFHPQKRYDFTPRIDLALGKNNTLTARFQFEHNAQTNAGLGATSLASTANDQAQHDSELQISDTQIFGSKVINETRIAIERQNTSQTPVSTTPGLTITGYFTGGGSSMGVQTSTNDHFELQNYTSIALQKNFIRAGMRLRINREALYSTAGSNGSFTYQSAADYINNQPFQYRVTAINVPSVEQHLSDVGFYAEDDYRIKPNLSLSYGIRYEAQGAIHSSGDLAPRVAVSYGIPKKNGNPTTVLRAGFGIFYDRFVIADTIQTLRQNGVNQVTNIYRSPQQGCSPTNITLCGTGGAVSATVYQLGPALRSAYTMQSQVGVDQQIGKRSTISFNYLNSIGVHQYLSRALPSTGSNLVYQYQSGGVFRQNQFIVNVRTQISNKFSIFGFYALNGANSNANGADSFPTDSVNSKTDYGRALFVQKHRIFMFGNWQAPFGINLSPFLSVNSGSYYNITTGQDNNGDSIINDRAGFANGVSGNCGNFADFTTSVTAANRVPVGYCTGPSNVQGNLRIAKVFGFGKRNTGPQAAGQDGGPGGPGGGGPPPGGGGPGGGGPGGGGGGGRGGPGGGGPPGGGFGGGGGNGRTKYTINLGAQIQNLFNYVPYATPSGSLSAPSLFGKSTSLASFGPGGSSSAVRTITLQMNFSF